MRRKIKYLGKLIDETPDLPSDLLYVCAPLNRNHETEAESNFKGRSVLSMFLFLVLRDVGPAGFEFHGAAGNKALYVVQGKADAYVSPFYLMRWDLCAPEALLKSRLGIATGL